MRCRYIRHPVSLVLLKIGFVDPGWYLEGPSPLHIWVSKSQQRNWNEASVQCCGSANVSKECVEAFADFD